MSLPPKIAISGLAKAFGAKPVLTGVELAIAAGESVVIIGGSGSGKSVLLKCILGLVVPDSGSIRVDGEETVGCDQETRDRVNAKFGMLFQGAALFDSLSVWENVAFGLIHAMGASRDEARPVALRNMAAVGLPPEVGDLSPAELSGGMKKRVGLARAITTKPEILFFDEPTTGLDPIMSAVIDRLIINCVKGLGATAVSITHDMHSARRIAHRIAMLHGGRIVWQGPVGEIDRSGNQFVDQFIHGRAEGPIQMQVRA